MISYDVTVTIFIYQNNQMVALLVGFKFLTPLNLTVTYSFVPIF